jgi:aminoglycoside phosphotransferase family enzyme/predicted kinase
VSALPPVIEAMRAPGFYPTRPTAVELVQTHISYVFLLGSRVYKVKKPVRFAFLDFSTLERRRHFCHEEVRLNRRLARGVYLGVRAIVARDGGFALDADDAPDAVEYAVEMCRLPANRVLAHLVDSGAATPALIDQIAERLVAFHAEADAGPAIAAAGDPATVARLMDEDFAEVAALHGDTIAAADDRAIQEWCHAGLRRHDALLRRRQAEGRVRDGHGDLHAEHVYCRSEQILQIVDCIEFNPAFRHRDVAADLAFLAMDLEYRGHPELAARLVATYAARSGDAELPALVPLFACHRAYIRGKVDSLKSREAEVDPADRAAARDSAVRHFALARRYTWSDVRALVVVTGLSGSGKSTIAAALAERTGFLHVNSDRTRKRLAGLAPTARGGAELYTPQRNAATHAAMYTAVGEALAAGHGVVLDATFQRRAHRDQAAAVAAAAGVPLLFVECRADDAVIRQRLAERAARDDDPSDADWEVYRRQRRFYEPLAADEPHLTIDTARPLVDLLVAIEERIIQR